MGLSSTTPIQFYLGNGSSTVFSFPYEFFNASDLQVFLFDTNTAIIYPQAIGSNYTVFGTQSYNGTYLAGGGITTTSAFPVTTELIIFRNPAQVQNFVLNQNSPINSLALTQQLDYLTAITQALQYQASQSLSLPPGQGQINGSSFSMLLPSNIAISGCSALMVLQVNSGATGWQLSPLSGSSGGGGGGSFTGSISLTNQVQGILPFANGGTNAVGPYSVSGVIYGSGGATFASIPPGSPGQVLTFQGSSAPTWTSVSASGSTSLTNQVSGILPTANGGTNSAGPYSIAGIIFASTATQFSSVPPGSPGQVLTFQGSSTPTWSTINAGSVSLTTGVTGTLPLLNGGTGTAAASANAAFNALSPITAGGQIIAGSGVTNFAVPAGTLGQALLSQGSNPPAWSTISNGSTAILSTIITTCSMVVSAPTSLILANSGQMTIQLFSAAGNAGAQVHVKKIDSGNGVISISASSASATIDGSINPFQLLAQNEKVELCCDGTNWQVMDYYHQPISMRWTAASASLTNAFNPITWRTLDYDRFGLMAGSSGQITINRAGKWQIHCNMIYNQTAVAGDNFLIGIYVNGVQKSFIEGATATSQTDQDVQITDILNLNLNDTVVIEGLDSNTSPFYTVGSAGCYVTAFYLGQ